MKKIGTLSLLALLVFSIILFLEQNHNIPLNTLYIASVKSKAKASQPPSLLSSAMAPTEANSINSAFIDNTVYANVKMLSSVFGQGGEWNEQFADNALSQLNGLQPDFQWIDQLQALPDNTWLEANSIGIPALASRFRAEVPMIYMPDFNIMFYTAGDGEEFGSYNSDSWVYSLNANTWVQMQPNYIKNSNRNLEPYPTDRPAGRCSFGLSYDTNRSKLVLRGGANTGSQGRSTWEYDPAINRWEKTTSTTSIAYNRTADNNIGFIPGFGTVEVGGDNNTTESETWVYRPEASNWEQITTNGAPPGAHNSPLVWASNQERLIYWAVSTSELWAFDPLTSTWEDISPEAAAPETLRSFYRHGMAYDSTNDVIIMYGSKNYNNDVLSMGPWVYSFETNTWEDMNPSFRPPNGSGSGGQNQQMAYDPEHNVVVITGNGRGTWIYRYKTPNALSVEEPSLSSVNSNLEVYPNPFSIETNIWYSIEESSNVHIKIYNLLGQHIHTLVNKNETQGRHLVIWDGKDDSNYQVAPGTYVLKMQTGRQVYSHKIIMQ